MKKHSVIKAIVGVTATVAATGMGATAAFAETDVINSYSITANGQVRGHVMDLGVKWGTGCSVKIGSINGGLSGVKDTRADGTSVTLWRKFNGTPFDSRWKRIGYDDTSTAGAGTVFSDEYFCDSRGAWIALCWGNSAPTANSTTANCVVDYRADNS